MYKLFFDGGTAMSYVYLYTNRQLRWLNILHSMQKVLSIATADSLLRCGAEKFCHVVKDLAAPQVHVAIKHPEKCFSVLDMSHSVSSTLKHFPGSNKSNPQPAMPQAGITGRARQPLHSVWITC